MIIGAAEWVSSFPQPDDLSYCRRVLQVFAAFSLPLSLNFVKMHVAFDAVPFLPRNRTFPTWLFFPTPSFLFPLVFIETFFRAASASLSQDSPLETSCLEIAPFLPVFWRSSAKVLWWELDLKVPLGPRVLSFFFCAPRHRSATSTLSVSVV